MNLTIWEDDLPEEVVERLSTILCEKYGIILRYKESDSSGEFSTKTYEIISLAEKN